MRTGSCALTLALVALTAFAFPTPRVAAATRESDEVKEAKVHWKHGQDAYDAGRFEEALREFEAGYALVARPAFLLNMAHAARRMGELKRAKGLYKRYLVAEPDSQQKAEVEELLRDIEAKLTVEAAPAAPEEKAVPFPTAPVRPPAAPEPAPAVLLTAPAPAPASETSPVYKRWWFWTAAGAVVAAAGVTAFLLLGADDTEPGMVPTLGTIGTPK